MHFRLYSCFGYLRRETTWKPGDAQVKSAVVGSLAQTVSAVKEALDALREMEPGLILTFPAGSDETFELWKRLRDDAAHAADRIFRQSTKRNVAVYRDADGFTKMDVINVDYSTGDVRTGPPKDAGATTNVFEALDFLRAIFRRLDDALEAQSDSLRLTAAEGEAGDEDIAAWRAMVERPQDYVRH
jgi:hypothetical protein